MNHTLLNFMFSLGKAIDKVATCISYQMPTEFGPNSLSNLYITHN